MAYQSAGAEEYLEAIYQLGELGEEATTSRLAEWLEVAPPSVSEMVRRLGEQGLVDYQPYRHVSLTEAGCARASRLLRRQRLWEVFLFDHLHVRWHQVFDEACNLEHGTSALTEAHLERFLGHPSFCPHGYPIPEVQEQIPVLAGTPLATLEVGQHGTVHRIPERHSDVLKYLESQGIMPGVQVAVIEKAPFDGPVTVGLQEKTLPLSLKLAEIIIIDPASE
jgi:DtxR family Mn-dependent transcriptional regulator